jgi:alkaline phosphatase D
MNRRQFVQTAAAIGATVAFGGRASASKTQWRERRDLFPEGVASGDPAPDSVILWTRRPYDGGGKRMLVAEIATDPDFRHVVATAPAPVLPESDWTCRVLVGSLKPSRVYWYRFSDSDGNGSRIGRTITAPRQNDPRPVNFAFVSCQDVNEGKLNAYRRMIFEDLAAASAEQLGFVLHLGDFIYEVVQYPEEVKTRYDRTIYEVARLPAEPDSFKVSNFHVPLTVDGYRAIYKGYLHDPDLQDARARWPFVCMWDNHEFSWQGRQSVVQAGGPPQPGQTVKVAANQAWFEYIPARVKAPSGSLSEFGPVPVKNVAIEKWDGNGLGVEPNNLTAIRSLIAYRSLRYGKHLDLLITDQHSFCGDDPTDGEQVGKIYDPTFNGMFSEEATIALDEGRAANGGNPPATLSFRDATIDNPRKGRPPRRRAEGMVQGQAARIDRDLENLGQFARSAGYPGGSAKSPCRAARKVVAQRHIRDSAHGRLRRRLCRAKRNLRPRSRREGHWLCDRIGRPAQLLGRLCGCGAPAPKVRTGRPELCRWVAGQSGGHGVLRTWVQEAQSAQAALRRLPAWRGETGLDL